jgi:hypothetical protein
MQTQPSGNIFRSSSLPQAAERVNSARFREAQLLIWCARTSVSEITRRCIRGVAQDGPALYFSLKDSWWERWRCGLVLLHHDPPILRPLPSWFRWQKELTLLAHIVQPLRGFAVLCHPVKSLRRAFARLFLGPAH